LNTIAAGTIAIGVNRSRRRACAVHAICGLISRAKLAPPCGRRRIAAPEPARARGKSAEL
jgi:hypothetical protein